MSENTDVLDEVSGMLAEVIGTDLMPVLDIGRHTTLAEDLALESIEFVALMERVRRRYGERIDMPGFLASLNLDRLASLTVGDLVRHIETRLSHA